MTPDTKMKLSPTFPLLLAALLALALAAGCSSVRKTPEAPPAGIAPPLPPAAGAGDAQANACVRVAYTELHCAPDRGYRAVYTNLCPAPVRVVGCDRSKDGGLSCNSYDVEGNGRNAVSLGSCTYGELARWGACRRPDRACDERLDELLGRVRPAK